jgi:hypothetical protein
MKTANETLDPSSEELKAFASDGLVVARPTSEVLFAWERLWRKLCEKQELGST